MDNTRFVASMVTMVIEQIYHAQGCPIRCVTIEYTWFESSLPTITMT